MSLNTAKQADLIQQAKLLEFANSNRNAGSFNDVTIQTGDESIPANRMVLACYSKFFESMFRSQLKEKYQNTVEIKKFDGHAIGIIIQFIYARKIDITSKNVMVLLRAADFLQVDEVMKMCFNYLETSLTVDSCFEVVKASDLYHSFSPLRKTTTFISNNFDQIFKTDKFKNLSKQEFISFLKFTNRINVLESSLYSAILEWVKHDQAREVEFLSLFLILDLQKLSSDFVLGTIAEEPLVQANKDCLNAVLSYFKTKHAAPKMLCFENSGKATVIEVQKVRISQSTYPNIPNCSSTLCMLLKDDNFVYSLHASRQVFRMKHSAAHFRWEEIASLNEQKSAFGAAAWNGNLVVAGGKLGRRTAIKSTELYKTCVNEWKYIEPMTYERYNHQLVVANNKLFAVGGQDGSGNFLASVEQLDNENGKWIEIKSMNKPRTSFAAVTCNNYIYAIGGVSSKDPVNTVERYDLHSDRWSFVRSMNEERMKHAACVFEGKIFVFGGSIKNYGNPAKTITCNDPERDIWTTIVETELNIYGPIIVAV